MKGDKESRETKVNTGREELHVSKGRADGDPVGCLIMYETLCASPRQNRRRESMNESVWKAVRTAAVVLLVVVGAVE